MVFTSGSSRYQRRSGRHNRGSTGRRHPIGNAGTRWRTHGSAFSRSGLPQIPIPVQQCQHLSKVPTILGEWTQYAHINRLSNHCLVAWWFRQSELCWLVRLKSIQRSHVRFCSGQPWLALHVMTRGVRQQNAQLCDEVTKQATVTSPA